MQLKPEIQNLLDFKRKYCEKHQILYTDTHVRGDILLIGEVFKLIGNSVIGIELERPKPTTFDMDIYRDMIPNARIDYNKREKEID